MAKRKMTRDEAKAWKERWEIVNAFEREELRAASPLSRMRQVAALMRSAKELGWSNALAEGEELVRARWTRLSVRAR